MAPKTYKAAFCVALFAASTAHPAIAQRSLAHAIGGAMSREAQIIDDAERATKSGPTQERQAAPERSANSRVHAVGGAQEPLGHGDALANVEATTCKQANGTTIRFSGGFTQAATHSTDCH